MGRSALFVVSAAVLLVAALGAAADVAAPISDRYVRNGVIVDFEARPVSGDASTLIEGQLAEIRIKLTEEATGAPVSGITPGVWMDIGGVIAAGSDGAEKSCKEKIALYLKGVVGIRPMLDLNSYYIVVMNREPSLAIIDPLVSMAGVTSTLGVIPLAAPGADWARSLDEKLIYVSMPDAGRVAVVDTDSFKVLENIDAGAAPTRTALQPDGRYLWVGNSTREAGQGGVTVIDTETREAVAFIATGEGHHEIAFSSDSRHAFVSNRNAGTVSVIDVQSRERIKDLQTGPVPISLAFSELAQSLYVADGETGTVSVIGGSDFEITRRVAVESGLGPLRFTPDGRWALVVNPMDDAVFIIDAASSELLHRIDVPGQPYQLAFSDAFAYVRSLDSERVTMINLRSLGAGEEPIVQGFEAGNVAPKFAGNLPLADSVTFTSTEAAVFVVNPADDTTYFYMEGMNAPSSNYKVYGSSARAVTVVDRSMREIEPGVFASKVKIPAAGRYDVAFLLDTPEILHCFSAEVSENPLIDQNLGRLAIDYSSMDRRVPAGTTVPIHFRLTEPASGAPRVGLTDVSVLTFRAPGRDRHMTMAQEIGDGVYRAEVPFEHAGAYYVHVGIATEQIGYSDLPYFTLVAARPATTEPAP
jgi:DNA-binding beta-propeller fold protein YncE